MLWFYSKLSRSYIYVCFYIFYWLLSKANCDLTTVNSWKQIIKSYSYRNKFPPFKFNAKSFFNVYLISNRTNANFKIFPSKFYYLTRKINIWSTSIFMYSYLSANFVRFSSIKLYFTVLIIHRLVNINSNTAIFLYAFTIQANCIAKV